MEDHESQTGFLCIAQLNPSPSLPLCPSSLVLPFLSFPLFCSFLGDTVHGRLISYSNTLWKLIMDKLCALCTHTNAVHAVSKEFARHIIRRLLNVYLPVAEREEWTLPTVQLMCHYWFYHKGCKSIFYDHLNPTDSEERNWADGSFLEAGKMQ